MSFLTAASDRSSSGSGVSGVSGASFSGVSGFTSSFSFTTVLVLVAINISYRPCQGKLAHQLPGPPTLWGESLSPPRDSPSAPHGTQLIYLQFHCHVSPRLFTCQDGAVPEFRHRPTTHSQKVAPNLGRAASNPRLTIFTAGFTRYPAPLIKSHTQTPDPPGSKARCSPARGSPEPLDQSFGPFDH